MIGRHLNNYEIRSRLGEGGMGTVYLAEHPFMRRKAAVKVLRRSLTEDPAVVARFMNEARAANAVRHPNIIDIIDVGTFPDGVPYLMMEFLDGETLGARLARLGKLSVPMALDFATQTAAALAAAHAAGIVHRDLKPDNLFIIRDGTIPGAERVKVLDFGIAKLRADVSGSASETSNGVLLGTPYYMSPEQCRGMATEIDLRTDVYALGVILYEMLCGVPPFQSQGAGELLVKHISLAPESPRLRNREIPAHVDAAIMKALAKRPADRFASMDDFAAALTEAGRRSGPALARALAATALPSPNDVPTLQAPARPRAEITTFRTGAAEVTPLPPPASKRRWALAWMVSGAAAIIGVGLAARLFVHVGRAPSASPPASSTSAMVPPAAPAPAPSAPPPPVAPAATATPPARPSSDAIDVAAVMGAGAAGADAAATADHRPSRHGPGAHARSKTAAARAAAPAAPPAPGPAPAAPNPPAPSAEPTPAKPGPPVPAPPAAPSPTRKVKRW